MTDNLDREASETIEIVPHSNYGLARWAPIVGTETLALLERLNLKDNNRVTVQNEAVSVLARCVPPTWSAGQETGLVIGYVQSGKTMSFTTVAALARDNGYRIVIVLTGITRNLFEQSTERLRQDLRVDNSTDRAWKPLDNPKARLDVRQRIENAIDWDNCLPNIPKQTVLITVMKNRTHLNNLIKLVSHINLRGIPVLVIDDEADQASLNNLVNQGELSPTYQQIVHLRQYLPHHSFLEYTATPQAPLLISIIDVLSPRFVFLLTPGPGYTGGQVFFENDIDLVRTIPLSEIPSAAQPLTEPPDSLLEAMRVFFLGVAVGLMQGVVGNRSMMVHPSKTTMEHANYIQWVRSIQENWSKTLDLPENDMDYQDLVQDFLGAYEDLQKTVDSLPSFQELLPYLKAATKSTVITLVNAVGGKTPQINWKHDYSNILVGGEVLNRGFTVEGLTVTYMPRGRGVGNADTIQQRARWFGYKAGYLGFCRVYLAPQTLSAYRNYVTHEEDIRDKLQKHQEEDRPLYEWRRAFFSFP
jgi:hypothetical protein